MPTGEHPFGESPVGRRGCGRDQPIRLLTTRAKSDPVSVRL